MELHALTLAACSYALLHCDTATYENDGKHRDSQLCSQEPKQFTQRFASRGGLGTRLKTCCAFMCTGLAVASVCALTFFDSSWKKSLARSAIFCSGSSRQSAIALI